MEPPPAGRTDETNTFIDEAALGKDKIDFTMQH